jgi:hypothetical protein
VRAPKTTASVSEIKSQVVANMNAYFSIDKWDFGDSFFFSELAAYLHEQMGSIISSVVLVPLNPLKTFGDLYEIRSAPNEIFANAATVTDVEVIEALTQSNLRTQTSVSGLYPSSNTFAQGSAGRGTAASTATSSGASSSSGGITPNPIPYGFGGGSGSGGSSGGSGGGGGARRAPSTNAGDDDITFNDVDESEVKRDAIRLYNMTPDETKKTEKKIEIKKKTIPVKRTKVKRKA